MRIFKAYYYNGNPPSFVRCKVESMVGIGFEEALLEVYRLVDNEKTWTGVIQSRRITFCPERGYDTWKVTLVC